MATKLTAKQETFVERYLISLNATQAAKEAGYSEKTAHRIGAENMQKPAIVAAIQEKRAEAQKRNEVTLDRIISEYATIAFSGMSKFIRINAQGEPVVDLSKCTPDDLDLLAETTIEDFTDGRGEDARDVRRVKIKTLDRLKALETLGRHLGLGDKAHNDTTDRLTAAIMEINRRGSAAPIKTAQRAEPKD